MVSSGCITKMDYRNSLKEAMANGKRWFFRLISVPNRVIGLIFFVKGKAKDKQFFLDNEEILVTWGSGGKDFKKIPSPDFAKFGNLFSVSTIDQKNYFFFETATFTCLDAEFQKIKMGGVKLPGAPLLVRQSPFSGEFYFSGSNFLAKGPEFDQPTTII